MLPDVLRNRVFPFVVGAIVSVTTYPEVVSVMLPVPEVDSDEHVTPDAPRAPLTIMLVAVALPRLDDVVAVNVSAVSEDMEALSKLPVMRPFRVFVVCETLTI